MPRSVQLTSASVSRRARQRGGENLEGRGIAPIHVDEAVNRVLLRVLKGGEGRVVQKHA
eukprot:CAMPEP_0206172598 /NCGR_PEP_ID=MMETSP1474-20131121/46068_1 /ASSEMBLY_ACC=CAM_ASM_001110 /TAXON_ID=97495 /ORGANISM="Imantonia sp., Strain RCC918" /LENGTH=58 /DNA_ID=CAMNT_0053580859 /DNA_START=126 /DNA_END=298 /DNA_ORIENTATION=-